MKIRRNTAIILSLIVLSGLPVSVTGPVTVQATSSTREKLNRTQKEKENLEDELDKTQDNLDQLEGKRDTLEKELKYLNAQLSAVVASLEELEAQIYDKEGEIAETQQALETAREKEAQQYENMVAVTRCLYEQQNDSYLTILLTAESFSDFLNMADRIEKVASYDQRMLEEYQENCILIEEHERRLQTEKTQLEELQAKAEEEKDKVSDMINQTSGAIAKYGDQISSAEKKALDYEAEIRKKEEDLEYLKKKLAEEIALSQAAANGTWRDISEVSFAEGDRRLLANLIYWSGQFSPVGSGRLDIALASDKATESCYRAADEAMSGVTNVGTCVFFRTPIEGLSGINIGGHVFY